MRRAPSHVQQIRSFADEVGVSTETTEFATDIAHAVSRSGYATDRLTRAVAAGCLYTAALATGSGTNGGLRFEQSFQGGGSTAGPRSRPQDSDRSRGHYRADRKTTQMTICKAADITPVSLRKYSREIAADYLESSATIDGRTRERLGRLALR